MCQQHVHISQCGPHGRGHGHGQSHSACCCCCGGHTGHEVGATPWRHFAPPEERTARLQAYLKDLQAHLHDVQAEAEAVEARIAELESDE